MEEDIDNSLQTEIVVNEIYIYKVHLKVEHDI